MHGPKQHVIVGAEPKERGMKGRTCSQIERSPGLLDKPGPSALLAQRRIHGLHRGLFQRHRERLVYDAFRFATVQHETGAQRLMTGHERRE